MRRTPLTTIRHAANQREDRRGMTEVAIALHDETQTQAQGLNRVDCRRQHRLRHRRRFGSNTGKLRSRGVAKHWRK